MNFEREYSLFATKIAFAPNALTPLGGYPGTEDKARELFAKLDQKKATEDFVAATTYLRGFEDFSGKMGVVGFCYGGGMAHTLATRLPELNAAVPFYGNHPPAEDAAKAKVPLLIHFAAADERINAAWPVYEAALKAAGANYTAHQYPGTNTWAPSTASTTTPHRAMTRPLPNWPGNAPWRFLAAIFARPDHPVRNASVGMRRPRSFGARFWASFAACLTRPTPDRALQALTFFHFTPAPGLAPAGVSRQPPTP